MAFCLLAFLLPLLLQVVPKLQLQADVFALPKLQLYWCVIVPLLHCLNHNWDPTSVEWSSLLRICLSVLHFYVLCKVLWIY